MKSWTERGLIQVTPADGLMTNPFACLLGAQVGGDSGCPKDSPGRKAVLWSDRFDPVTEGRQAACREDRRNKWSSRQGSQITVIRISYIDQFGNRDFSFPGSTIGNLVPEQAITMLRRMKGLVGDRGAILLGLDLAKSRVIIEPAYNDSEGLTAAFNLNALKHVNRVTGTDFNVSAFEHRAIYRPEQYRVEMHLISSANQTVRINGQCIPLEKGNHIVTEYSYKYSLEVFDRLLATAGLRRIRTWFDRNRWFSLQFIQSSACP